MNNKFNSFFKRTVITMLMFVFSFVALFLSFSVTVAKADMNIEVIEDQGAVYFIKDETNFDGNIILSDDYYASNVREAISIKSGETKARAYIVFPTGFDTTNTKYQILVNKDSQPNFTGDMDANDHSSWKSLSESKFIDIDGFDHSVEGTHYVHVRFKLIGSDEIFLAHSTEITVDNTNPGVDVTWDPTIPTADAVKITAAVSDLYGIDVSDMNVSMLESIKYRKGEFATYDEFVADAAAGDIVDLTFNNEYDETNHTFKFGATDFKFETTTNGKFTICVMDRAGNVSFGTADIDNIYRNLKVTASGEYVQYINHVSPFEFSIDGDEVGSLDRMKWYLTTNGTFNETPIATGVDEYTFNVPNKVAKYSIKVVVDGLVNPFEATEFEVKPLVIDADDIEWNEVSITKVYDGTTDVKQTIEGLKVKDSTLTCSEGVTDCLTDIELAITKLYYESKNVSASINVFADIEITGDDISQFDFESLKNEAGDKYVIKITNTGDITVKNVTVTLVAVPRAYNGSKLVDIDVSNCTIDGIIGADKPYIGLSIYSAGAGVGTENKGLMDTKDAGTNTVTAEVSLTSTQDGLHNNYRINTMTPISVEISKVSARIILEDREINYGDVFSYTTIEDIRAEGLIDGETLSNIGYNLNSLVINDGNPLPKNQGVHTITIGGDDSSTNYDFTFVNGTLTIKARKLLVVLKDTVTGSVYDGDNKYDDLQNPENYVFTTLVSGDETKLSKVVFAVTEIKNVGEYTIKVTGVSFTDSTIDANYEVEGEDKVYEITQRPLTLVIDAEDKYYDGTNNVKVNSCGFTNYAPGEELTVVCDSFKTADANVSYSGNLAVAKEVSYNLSVSNSATADTDNYSWEKPELSITILPNVINLTHYDFISKMYDGGRNVTAGDTILTVSLPGGITERVKLSWEDNLYGFETPDVSEDITVTLVGATLSDDVNSAANHMLDTSNVTLGEITPVDVNVKFALVEDAIRTIVYDGTAKTFKTHDYYTFDYAIDTVPLKGYEGDYVLEVKYRAYKDASKSVEVMEIKDILLDENGNVLPYYIEIYEVELDDQIIAPYNYNFKFEELGKVIISKQPLTIKFESKSLEYTGTNVVTFDVSDFEILGHLGENQTNLESLIASVKYTFYTEACVEGVCPTDKRIDTPRNVGTYYAVAYEVTPVDEDVLKNYNITYLTTGTLTITPVELKVYYTGNSGPYYTGENTVLESSNFYFNGLVGEDTIEAATVTYTIDGKSTAEATLKDVKRTEGYTEGSQLGVEGYVINVTNVAADYIGNYTVDYTVPDGVNNKYTINPIELRLNIKAINREYNKTNIVEFESSDRYTIPSGVDEEFEIRYSNATISDVNAGTYTIGVDDYTLEVIPVDPAKVSNYYWEKIGNIEVVISPKELDINDLTTNYACNDNPNKQCKQYDGSSAIPSDFAFTIIEGVEEGDTVEVEFDRVNSKFVQFIDQDVEAIDAGPAYMAIKVIYVKENTNYKVNETINYINYPAIIEKRVLNVGLFDVNEGSIVKLYDGTTDVKDLNVVVNASSGLQKRNGVDDDVKINATAVYNSANVVEANYIDITFTDASLTGTHAANYELSSMTRRITDENQTGGTVGYEVKINPIEITVDDININNGVKVYDAKKAVSPDFEAYASNADWPDAKVGLTFSAAYLSATASDSADILINIIDPISDNYVLDIAGNKVTVAGKIERYEIKLSTLVIDPKSKTYDGNNQLTPITITIADSDAQVNEDGVKDVITVIAPDAGTFMKEDNGAYINDASIGTNKFLKVSGITLDATSIINYVLVDDEGTVANECIYSGFEIKPLKVTVKFIGTTETLVYDAQVKDLSSKDLFQLDAGVGSVPTELTNIAKLSYSAAIKVDEETYNTVDNVINAGTYKITPTVAAFVAASIDVNNYTFEYIPGEVVVEKANASVKLKADLAAPVYTGLPVNLTDPATYWEYTGFADTITSILPDAGQGTTIKNAGSYLVKAGTIAGIDENNYIIDRTQVVTFKVEAKVVDVNTFTVASRQYNGSSVIDKSLFTVELDSTDFVNGETITYTIENGKISAPDASETPYTVTEYDLKLANGVGENDLASNYKLGTYNDPTVVITKRTIKLSDLGVKDVSVLKKPYDASTIFTNIIEITVKASENSGLVIRENADVYDEVKVTYTNARYASADVGPNNSVVVSGLAITGEPGVTNYELETNSTSFTDDAGGYLITAFELSPENFEVSPAYKVYDGDTTPDSFVIQAVGVMTPDTSFIKVEYDVDTVILSDHKVGTVKLIVENIRIVDVDSNNPKAGNYTLDDSRLKSEYNYVINPAPVDNTDIEAKYNGELISHENPLRMPYVPGNSTFNKISSVVLTFKDGVMLHADDMNYKITTTNVEFLDSEGNPATAVNRDTDSIYYTVKITFTVEDIPNYEYTGEYVITIVDSAIIDPTGVVIKAKEFSKIYGESDSTVGYNDPTVYTWVYYDGDGNAENDLPLSQADYDYLTQSIGLTISRTISKETQQVNETGYELSVTYDSSLTENYDIIVEDLVLVINKRDIKVHAVASSIHYDSPEAIVLPEPTVDVSTPLVVWNTTTWEPSTEGSGDRLGGLVSAVNGSGDVLVAPYTYGTYSIVKAEGADDVAGYDNHNYNIVVVPAEFKVTDTIDPTIGDEITLSGWSKTSVTVTFTATEPSNASGIDYDGGVYYCDENEITCGQILDHTGDTFKFSVTENGNYIIKVKDIAGNEVRKSVEVFNVLTSAPDFEIESSYVDGTYLNKALPIIVRANATTTYHFDSDYASTLCVSIDAGSCATIDTVFGVDGSKTYEATFNYEFNSDISGEHTITFMLTDVAGNTRSKSMTVKTIYISTTAGLSGAESIMDVDFGINNYDKVEEMVTDYRIYYFFSRQYGTAEKPLPDEEAFLAHGVEVTLANGGSSMSSPLGLSGTYSAYIMIKVNIGGSDYQSLIYKSDAKTIKRLAAQPTALNLSNVIDNVSGSMVASHLNSDGSSIIVSNQTDGIATLSTSNKVNDYVIKYDEFGNEIYKVKLVVDGNYDIVDVVEDENRVYVLIGGEVASINGRIIEHTNSSIIVVIENGSIVDMYASSLEEGTIMKSISVSNGNVAVIGSNADSAIIIVTDLVSEWRKVIAGVEYEDVAINGETVVAVGSTSEVQFMIDDRLYNGGVTSRGGRDAIMISFNLEGNVGYVKRLTSNKDDRLNLVEFDDNSIIVAGITKGARVYYSRYASIVIGDENNENAFIVEYDTTGYYLNYTALTGDGDEYFKSISLSEGLITTTVMSTSDVVTPTQRSGSPIIIEGDKSVGFVITYNMNLEIEDVCAGTSSYAITMASRNTNTSQLMILSNSGSSYMLQTQRFISTLDIVLERIGSSVFVNVDGINVKEIRVIKDGEFVDVENGSFEALENGTYTVSVVDEYDMVATKDLVVNSYVLDAATITKVENNRFAYSTFVLFAALVVAGIVVVRKRKVQD